MNRLNNKGFTLVEVLAVVAIIAIVSLIAVPSVLSIINTGKESSYEELTLNTKTAAENMYYEIDYMDATLYHYDDEGKKTTTKITIEDDGSIEVSLQTLVSNGFLTGTNNKKILNPKNNEEIGSCKIKITKITDDNQVYYKVENLNNDKLCPSTSDYTDENEEIETPEQTNLLSGANIGSYVTYGGARGCTNCSGENANSSSTSKGYCYNSYFEFNSSGWRIAYIEDGSVHLVSAGAPECTEYTNNLDSIAIKYCNPLYSYNGNCNSETTWAMNDSDFYKITGFLLTDSNCYGASSSKNCNISNDLTSIGSYYFLNTYYNSTSYYYTIDRFYLSSSGNNYGVRPVIKLDPSIIITGGEGTESNPYQISKQ